MTNTAFILITKSKAKKKKKIKDSKTTNPRYKNADTTQNLNRQHSLQTKHSKALKDTSLAQPIQYEQVLSLQSSTGSLIKNQTAEPDITKSNQFHSKPTNSANFSISSISLHRVQTHN